MNRKKKEFHGSNRREFRRLSPDEVPFLKSVALNQGIEAHVIDISRGGILLTTEARLRPQMRIILKVITSKGASKISGMVVRSSISSLDRMPIYKSAIAFDTPLSMLDDDKGSPEMRSEQARSKHLEPDMFDDDNAVPQSAVSPEDSDNDKPEVLTIHVPDGFGNSQGEGFRLNEW
jgi:hypothetical protein